MTPRGKELLIEYAVEAVCEQADIQKSDLNKMINAAVKEQLHELKEKTDALSELIDSVMD